jgi:hypothetical protein
MLDWSGSNFDSIQSFIVVVKNQGFKAFSKQVFEPLIRTLQA